MRVAVGLSGGVDSAVAALILKERGEDVVGVTMTIGRAGEAADVAAARAVATRLGFAFRVCALASLWKREVADYIGRTYGAGETPNPCVRCNALIKFGALPRWAFGALGCDRFATGHYARLEDGRLFRGADRVKDQSYFLYRMPEDVRRLCELPLGALTKREVRAYARAAGLAAASRGDSQDFCGGDVRQYVAREDRPGRVVTAAGKELGTHRGYWHYTIGQRKGLNIGGGGTPYYVIGIRAARNEVVVGVREEAVRHALTLGDTVGEIDYSLPVKVRSAGEPRLLADGIMGVAPGQSAVFFRGDEVVGGGIIR